MALNQILSRLAEPARWIVIGGIAFTLANLVLFFIAPPDRSATSSGAQRPAASAPDRRPAVSVNAILSRNLFGEAGAQPQVADNQAPAVETRLPLELLGVFVADVEAESAAIVAQRGKPGELYIIGAMLPGNAELLEVHNDHIVLRRAGARETLRFPAIAATPVTTPAAPGRSPAPRAGANPVSRAGEAQSARDFVTSYQEVLEEDPEGALRALGITPVAEGDAAGYRLDDAAASSPYLSQTGLQPGDVVLSVNGQPVGNIQQDRRQIDNILAQGSARIEVQRGTRRFFVTASLKQ
jgi:general secretion pathway protein C